MRHAWIMEPCISARISASARIRALSPAPPSSQDRHVPVRLHHEPGRQDRAAEEGNPARHLAVLFPGRQDRRARLQRRRQVDLAADHGRYRQGVSRRGAADAGPQGRLPAAGTSARPEQDRARERRGSPERDPAAQGRPRRGVRRLCRGERRLRQARRQAGRPRGEDRRRRRREPQRRARQGRRGAEPAALAASAAASRCAGCCCPSPT
jgi:hypothetical protein